MKTSDECRELAAALHQSLRIPISQIIAGSGTLLNSVSGTLNEIQRVDVNRIHKSGQALLAIIANLDQVESKEWRTHSKSWETEQNEQKSFLMLLYNLNSDLRKPIITIIGFSRLFLEDRNGPISDEQREELEHIHKLGKELASICGEVISSMLVESNADK